MLARIGIRFTPDECTMLLEENPNVFALVDGMYLTRAGAFTGQYFSMKPTRAEISKKSLLQDTAAFLLLIQKFFPATLRFFITEQSFRA